MLHRVVVAHNHYQMPGGEDRVFASEIAMLQAHGHNVTRFEDHNDRIRVMHPVSTAAATIWNQRAFSRLQALLAQVRPSLVHFHNTFPLISPAAYHAARRQGAAVVQTLHNYRLLCPAATFFREGAPCQQCVDSNSLLPSLQHGCYRQSRAATGYVAAMLSFHRWLGSWIQSVDVFIALSDFARQKFIEGGLPADRILVKHNFVASDPGMGDRDDGYALFVGRLTVEKGLNVLLDAWRQLHDVPLKIVGSGPLFGSVQLPNVHWLGQLDQSKTISVMQRARILIFPSIWFEAAPMVILEAFATGLPVLASDLGAMRDIVSNGRNGLRFRAGDVAHLVESVRRVWNHSAELYNMRRNARLTYEQSYTPEINYPRLLDVYRAAMARAAGRSAV